MATAVTATDAPVVQKCARAALMRLCAAGFLAYCSYAICRTPLLPLFARVGVWTKADSVTYFDDLTVTTK